MLSVVMLGNLHVADKPLNVIILGGQSNIENSWGVNYTEEHLPELTKSHFRQGKGVCLLPCGTTFAC